jgi:hypothetical protein
MILVQFSRGGRADALFTELQDLQDRETAGRVGAHLVPDAHGVARAHAVPVDTHVAGLAGIVSLSSRFEDSRGT